MENKIRTLLCDLRICDEDSIHPFYPKVRDRDDVSVLKCQKSGVIFLSRSDHMDFSHYEQKEDFQYWGAQDRKAAVLANSEDSFRRFDQFKGVIANKKWIDIGTGAGGILELLAPVAAATMAVEPQEAARRSLIEAGYAVFASIEQVPSGVIEVATLFHVFEHLTDPLATLEVLKSKMSSGGKVIIEVPHARDFLLSFLNLEAFKAFTLWSEHLILHTRDSLRILLEAAGFSDVCIKSFQRYPLPNHLYWLANAKPGGHMIWNQLRTPMLDQAYADMLAQLDCSDTLIAMATKGD